MSRLSGLAWLLAFLTLGAGAIGYAATGSEAEGAAQRERLEQTILPASPVRPEPLRSPDAVLVMPQGATLGAALLKAGTASLDAALAGGLAGDPEPGRSVRLWFGSALPSGTRPLERLEFRAGAARKIVVVRAGEEFVRREVEQKVDDTPVRFRLSGDADIAAALTEAGLPHDLRATIAGKLSGAQAASVDLIVAHEQSEEGSLYGAPLYFGLHLEDGSVRRWLGADGTLQPLGSAVLSSGLLQPVPGPVTSKPGLRFHPILRYLRWHRGTDFAAPAGTPVQAALRGRVVEAGWRGGYGRTVRLAHGDGSTTLYAHLRTISVDEGAEVPQGAIIGEVGASGLATGPHLHFEWLRGADTLRPAFAPAPGGPVDLAPQQSARLQALLGAPFRLPPPRRG